MTDKVLASKAMDIKEYAEQSYKGAALNAKLFARIPTRLSVWIETFAMANGVSSSDITRHALERYCHANGYDPQHKL
tara:strand:- start:647 stop:877 length:231 start_codon:yes stop_codon:yes gene_type:complete